MKLLVSVRNLDEALMAMKANVDIIDLKEPDRGSLGAVSLAESKKIGVRLSGSRTLSIAFGELSDYQPGGLDDPQVLNHFAFAKIGLAGCSAFPDWQSLWLNWALRIRPYSGPVLVAYADHKNCSAPDLRSVIELAASYRPAGFLIDTCRKNSKGLLDHYSVKELEQLLRPLRDKGVKIAIAGSLRLEQIKRIASLAPDLVGVRGAVCENHNRTSRLCSAMIADVVTGIQKIGFDGKRDAQHSDWMTKTSR